MERKTEEDGKMKQQEQKKKKKNVSCTGAPCHTIDINEERGRRGRKKRQKPQSKEK
jgi:hypothetical protein